MAVKKLGEKWFVDLYPEGRSGKRVRKKFDTKAEANRFEKLVLSRAHEKRPWNDSPGDKRTLKELCKKWHELKGIHLKDGAKRLARVNDIADWLGNPVAAGVKAADFLRYSGYMKGKGIAPKTINNHLGYLNAVYNYLHRIGEIEYSNPLARVEMIRLDERELSWLSSEQIAHLLKTIAGFSENPHVHLLTKICLATGARWGEAESLTARNVRDGKVSFHMTKGGKSRAIPISKEFQEEILAHFRKFEHFSPSLSAFRRALKVSEIVLPKGQAAHVLRHTFASHFVMRGGNILTLQRVLGHSTIVMTMRYAHLAPDHLADVLSLNPLSKY